MSNTMTEAAAVEGAVPILRVRDLAASIEYYVKRLGFKVDWQEPSGMASVSRDRGSVMLCEGDQGNSGTWIWFGASDVRTLFDEFSRNGADIPLPPSNFRWALEIHVKDPDGHVLRFGSEPLADQPFSEWVLWYRNGG